MRLRSEKLKILCRERHLSLKTLLKEAGVSRTAYYSLLRKESVLPKSVDRIARCLEVSPAGFLGDDEDHLRQVRKLQAQAEAIHLQNPESDRDVIFRTLRNLELPPVERLRRALVRARKPHIHG